MSIRRLTAALALSLALTPALAACAGDAITPPPLTPATSTVSSPTPTEQPETAEEFIRRWVQAGDEMQRTGDTKQFRSITVGCESCREFDVAVERIYADGGRINYDGTKLVTVRRVYGATYDVKVIESPTTYTDSATGPTHRLNGGAVTYRLRLRQGVSGWELLETTEMARSGS